MSEHDMDKDMKMTDNEPLETAAGTVDAVADGAEDAAGATADVAATDAADEVRFSIVFDDDDDEAPAATEVDAADGADAADDAGAQTASAAADEPAEPAAAPESVSDEAAAANAARVNETLALNAKAAAKTAQPAVESAAAEPAAMRLSARLDKELNRTEDKVLLRSYPTLAFKKVTLTDPKTGHNTLDRVDASFYAGHTYAIRVESDDERVALLSVMTGMMRPTDGAVMNKSLNVLEIEPGELRAHRLGIIPQRYALRDDLSAEKNVLYAMDASGRTFLKPKPVIARELLHYVHFDTETPNAPVGKLPVVQQRLVAIARAMACEAEIVIADEPTGGLDMDDSVTVMRTLLSLTHADPKRCVILITGDDEVAEVAESVLDLRS